MRTSTAKRIRSNGHALNSDWLKIKSSFSDTTSDARKMARAIWHDSASELKQYSKKIQNRVGDYTAKKPFRILGAALLTGVFLGIWLRRR